MARPITPPPRLAVLLARDASRALIFRRGPSKRVELVLWETDRDRFEAGQWFAGRIFERRCDLSPNGELLVYFASKYNRHSVSDDQYTHAWTAVSKPPYLTALALWPKGDTWWGGGLFKTNYDLLLNHRPTEAVPHPAHLPTRIRVAPNEDAAGEDDPLYSMRLERDGWTKRQAWHTEFHGFEGGYETVTPEIRERRHPNGRLRIILTRRLVGFRYSEHFEIEDSRGPVPLAMQDPRGLIGISEAAYWP